MMSTLFPKASLFDKWFLSWEVISIAYDQDAILVVIVDRLKALLSSWQHLFSQVQEHQLSNIYKDGLFEMNEQWPSAHILAGFWSFESSRAALCLGWTNKECPPWMTSILSSDSVLFWSGGANIHHQSIGIITTELQRELPFRAQVDRWIGSLIILGYFLESFWTFAMLLK